MVDSQRKNVKTVTLLLTHRDLLACGAADLDIVAAALEEMFRIHAAGQFTAPPSSFLKRPERPHVADRFIGLSAHLGGSFDVEGIKWIGSAHENPSRGLPRANAVIVLNDADTRLPLAIMEGGLISALRTAVVQGLAARRLARSLTVCIALAMPISNHANPVRRLLAAVTLQAVRDIFDPPATLSPLDYELARRFLFDERLEQDLTDAGIEIPLTTIRKTYRQLSTGAGQCRHLRP